jgi:hypothetical protein
MVFARRRSRIQQAIVEIGEASSAFLQFVAMVFTGVINAPRSTVIVSGCCLISPERRSGMWSAPLTR